MLLGTTYSHRQSAYLRLDPDQAFSAILDLGFNFIRIGCYWDEIEKRRGVYDFTAIERLLKQCEAKKQSVIVTIGMKAPRWPEYYFPDWLDDKTPVGGSPYLFAFIKKCIEVLGSYRCITHWQVENEPLDPSGPGNLRIPLSLLQEETTLVRNIDSRPVIINLWGNEIKKRNQLPHATRLADIVGLDIYYKVPVFASLYRGPQESDQHFATIVTNSEKPLWITELQAEPWERKALDPQKDTPSMNEHLLRENFKRVSAFNPEAIFFWGSEYWLQQKQRGDTRLYEAVHRILAENKT